MRGSVAVTDSWRVAAAAVPAATARFRRPPRLSFLQWPDSDEPLIIVELRPQQMAVVTPGFRNWVGDSVEAPFHRRGLVERTAAGAAVLINGVLVASGGLDTDLSLWGVLRSCQIAAVQLGQLTGSRFTRAAEFADLVEIGNVWLAEMPVVDLTTSWSRA